MAVSVPPAAAKLRRLVNMMQYVQSHALSFFHLSAPDLLLAWTRRRPSAMSWLGRGRPGIDADGIWLRNSGSRASSGSRQAGAPGVAVPGGVSQPLAAEARDRMLEGIRGR